MSTVRSALIHLAAIFSLAMTASVTSSEQVDPLVLQQQILEKQLDVVRSVLSPELQAMLAASQVAWVAHRDLNCAFQSSFTDAYANAEASVFESHSAQCIASMNQQRLQELQGYLNRLMRYQSRSQQLGIAAVPPTLPATSVPTATTPGSPASQAVIKEGTYLVNGT